MLNTLLGWLLDPSGLTPHGFCLLWEPGLIWTYASADFVTGAAYFMIPLVLVAFIRQRRDLVFRPLFWLFAAFILLCGVTHWLDLVTLWVPAYGVEGVAKAATAIVSVATAFTLWRLLPQALALPSPTQLQEANEALRKSEDFLARVSRVARIGGYELDFSTGTIYWSEEVRRLRGVAPGYEPTLQGALDFYTPESRPVISAAIDRAVACGGGWDLELEIINAEGRRLWIRNVGVVEFINGKATRLIGSFQDVNASVTQRNALADATKRMTLATDAGRIGIWDWDIASGTLAWDSWMYRLYGTDPQSATVPYDFWMRRIHPDDLGTMEQALRKALDSSKPFDIEYRVIWDDSSVHHLRASSSVTRDLGGHASRMVGACWDITEATELAAEVARQAEREIEAAERERAIFRNSSDTLFVVRVDEAPDGPEFVYETFSPAFERLTGNRLENMVGFRPDQCLPPEGADLVLQRYRRCVLARTSISYEETHESPNGLRDLEGSITPVMHPATGRIVRLIGAVRDVTERRRTEAALHHSQKLEAIGRLSAGVAHDFNNILQSIVGGLDMILQVVSEETARRFADISLNAAMRGAYLTHHLLSYARKQMLQPRDMEIAPFLAEFQILLARTLGPHIAIQVDAGQHLSVLADPAQLGTALLNLAINASHAMPKHGTLRVDAYEECNVDGAWIVVTVADSGTGMDAATLAQAAEPFFS
jgi:PAS domain S-box-containing protein